MDADLPNVYFNQYSTPEKLVIKTDAPLPNVYFNQRLTPKTRDIKWTHICRMSTLINALQRKLVIFNRRTFA